jgi:hypothetical protein
MTTQEVIDGSLTETVGKYRGVDVKFRDVWADNLEQEFSVIRRILDDYPYIGMVRRPSHRAAAQPRT